MILERLTKVGDSPVGENKWSSLIKFPSTAGHVKSCGKPGGPPSKAKYYLVTDSEPVPWGKGEKYSCEESEIVPETVCLQSVGAPIRRGDGVPFA